MRTNLKKRKAKDLFRNISAYFFSAVGVICLVFILAFIFANGSSVLSWDFLTSDYNSTTTTCSYSGTSENKSFADPHIDDVYFASNWGVGFEDGKDAEGSSTVIISYIDNASPFMTLTNSADDSYYQTKIGTSVSSALLFDKDGNVVLAMSNTGAQKVAESFASGVRIKTISLTTSGGGIRGSLISTLYMIFFTLLFGLPLGIGSAVFLSLFSKQGKITDALRGLIDLAGGIPSIIYGLVGAVIFIPFVNSFSSNKGGSILSGALTMGIMLLPIIIRTTEEAIKTVPSSYLSASLALGASKSQSVFKVVLPNSIQGILSGVLLAIGRIIGESAALIYAVGTAIKDNIILTEGSATLALHIWSLMGGENPNYQAACGVAIIIIAVDLFLNIIVKIINVRFNKRFKGGN